MAHAGFKPRAEDNHVYVEGTSVNVYNLEELGFDDLLLNTSENFKTTPQDRIYG
jgi:hypothetical protein